MSKSPNSMRPTLVNMPGSVFDKDAAGNNQPKISPVLGHHRAMSMNSDWPRFPSATNPSQNTPGTKAAQDRGAGILRRLSLSGGTPFQRVRLVSSPGVSHSLSSHLLSIRVLLLPPPLMNNLHLQSCGQH